MKKFWCIIAYIILGIGPTVFLFISHSWMCKYGMNPFCYIKCALPAIIAFPILYADGLD